MTNYHYRVLSLLVLIFVCPSLARAQVAFAWGANTYGQLGDGSTSGRLSPTPVIGMSSGVTNVSGGGYHILLVKSGAVWASGRNIYGQIGDGTTTERHTPVAVPSLSSGVTFVGGGQEHSLALKSGTVWSWGSNFNGQLGIGSSSGISSSPVQVTSLGTGVSAISVGHLHSLALKNGAVYGWGYNIAGQCGVDTNANTSSPVLANNLTANVTAISAGGLHSLAIKSGGIWSFGDNSYGQLGFGYTGGSNSNPSPVATLSSGVTAISAGSNHSLAVKAGAVYAWGSNAGGQLGDGTTTTRPTPFAVGGLPNNIVSVVAGTITSYALSSDHRLFAWGSNAFGEFGNGTTSSSLTPVEITAPPGYTFSSLDSGYSFAIASLTPVPEPSGMFTLGAVALGLAGCVARIRGSRGRASP